LKQRKEAENESLTSIRTVRIAKSTLRVIAISVGVADIGDSRGASASMQVMKIQEIRRRGPADRERAREFDIA
jgi:hypothetical protein